MPVSHGELCFGCGQANVFGLHLELERAADGALTGRWFVKQDHQGEPGNAHTGVVAAVLAEAMALALHADGIHAATRRFEMNVHLPAPVGSWVDVRARLEHDGDNVWAVAEAAGERGAIAEGRARFVVIAGG